MLPRTTYAQTTEWQDSASWRVWWRRRQRTVQKAPFNLPCPFYLQEGLSSAGGSIFTGAGSPEYDASQIAGLCSTFPDLESQAANLSYERFRDQTATNAALGVDFVEYRQSLDMIAKRAGTLLNFTRRLKKFDFIGAARVLAEAQPARVVHQHTRFGFSRIDTVPRGVSPHKTLANNWLEYHFGWQPLIQDVFDSMEILHNPVKKFASMKGSGKTELTIKYEPAPTGAILQRSRTLIKVKHKQGGFVKSISNDTLHSLEQYGLLNPAVLVWEVIPFSFVVDWFASVGDVLRSYSDFAGMTLDNTYSTVIVTANNAGFCVVRPGFQTIPPTPARIYSANGIYVRRTLALTKPVFSVKPLRLPSKIRAATAISLLVQFLHK